MPEGVSFYSGAYRKPNAEIAFRGYCGNPYINTCLRKTDGSVVLVNTGEGSSNFDFTNNGWWLLENYLGNSTRRVWATDGFTQTPSADVVLNEYLSNGGAVRFIVGMGPDSVVVVMEQVWDAVQSISRLRTADGADTRLFVC